DRERGLARLGRDPQLLAEHGGLLLPIDGGLDLLLLVDLHSGHADSSLGNCMATSINPVNIIAATGTSSPRTIQETSPVRVTASPSAQRTVQRVWAFMGTTMSLPQASDSSAGPSETSPSRAAIWGSGGSAGGTTRVTPPKAT